MSSKQSVHQTCGDLMSSWLKEPGAFPDQVEGIHPQLAQRFGVQAQEFTFDNFFHDQEVEGWVWRTFELEEIFKGAFFLYLPTNWSDLRHRKNAANVMQDNVIRQSLLVLDKEGWSKTLPEFLKESDIRGFAYYPLLSPNYHQWIVCTVDNNTGTDWFYGIYTAGDWVFITKGDAKDKQTYDAQLISVLNSNPWYGWLANAKEQSAKT